MNSNVVEKKVKVEKEITYIKIENGQTHVKVCVDLMSYYPGDTFENDKKERRNEIDYNFERKNIVEELRELGFKDITIQSSQIIGKFVMGIDYKKILEKLNKAGYNFEDFDSW